MLHGTNVSACAASVMASRLTVIMSLVSWREYSLILPAGGTMSAAPVSGLAYSVPLP